MPFLIFIDELDRCRPTYAIAMLERIKHLFNIPGIAVVLATDTSQLAHSIKSVYGQDFDSQKYLQRFLSRTYPLPSPPVANFIDAIVGPSGVDYMTLWAVPAGQQHPVAFLAEAAHHFKMTLREVERCIDLLIDISTMWSQAVSIQIAIMFPLLAAHIRGKDLQLHQRGWLYEAAGEIGNAWLVEDANAEKRYSVPSVIHSLLNIVNNDLFSLRQNPRELYQNGNYPAAFAASVMKEEIRTRFENSLRQGEFSWILQYPRIIEHAHFVAA